MENSKKSQSHNRYYEASDKKESQFRIRLYKNDKKILDKQIHAPHITTFSATEYYMTVLRFFMSKIAEESEKKDKWEYYNEEIINKMNRAYFIGNMFEMLRSTELENNNVFERNNNATKK